MRARKAGGIVLNPAGQLALTFQYGKAWAIPKGKLDGIETPFDAAVREIEEETGILRPFPIQPLQPYQYFSSKPGCDSILRTVSMFLFWSNQEHLTPTDNRHQARWVEWRDAYEMVDRQAARHYLRTCRVAIDDILLKPDLILSKYVLQENRLSPRG